MSVENVKQIIGRAINEPEFKELLSNDPDRALAGYELSEEEAATLKALASENFDAASGELEERISRIGLSLTGFAGDERQGTAFKWSRDNGSVVSR